MKGGKKSIHLAAFILLVVGGLNWLLVGLFQWDIGALLGGMDNIISRIIYVLVGLAAIYEVATHKKRCKECAGDEKVAKPAMSGTPGQA